MNTLPSRIPLVCVIVALFLVPLYAHHGNQFLSKAMEVNAAEVRLGQMAVNKTQNPRVKDFAEMLVKDHNEALDKIRELREARTVTHANTETTTGASTRDTERNSRSAADVTLTPDHQRTANRLSSLSGTEFDREFINEMVRGHREAIRDFEAQSHVHGNGSVTGNQSGTTTGQQTARQKPTASGHSHYSHADLTRDVDTADFAIDTLPTLRHHLEEAEAIQRELQRR
ncbi:MAG TPA: DUF4142 domain-containing protein [Terriglobia bacterium]|nr:DUF4142 domain-containing protein [Terriglobia bacterium]